MGDLRQNTSTGRFIGEGKTVEGILESFNEE